MAFNFNKFLPSRWKTKMPTNYEWEVHNLVAYKEKREKFARGEISYDELQAFEMKYRESDEQREFRWQQHNHNVELKKQISSDYQNWKLIKNLVETIRRCKWNTNLLRSKGKERRRLPEPDQTHRF